MDAPRPQRTSRQASLFLMFLAGMAVLQPISLMVAPVPVAVCAARGRISWALALLLPIAITGVAGFRSPEGGLVTLVVASMGLLIGARIRRQVSYGHVVLQAAGILFAFNVGVTFAQRETVEQFVVEAKADIEQLKSESDQELSLNEERIYTFQHWLLDHWPYVFPGLSIAGSLMGMSVAVSTTGWWLRRLGLAVRGNFASMRPPEWLVWFAIATAGLWYADQRVPNEALRMVAWNGAVGLTSVYWLNGLGIAIYAIAQLKPKPVWVALGAVATVYLGLLNFLPLVGLFDTWAEYRRRIDERVAARNAEPPPNSES